MRFSDWHISVTVQRSRYRCWHRVPAPAAPNVKHVLSRHQARLEVASEPGRGSTFSAVFPAKRRTASVIREAFARSA